LKYVLGSIKVDQFFLYKCKIQTFESFTPAQQQRRIIEFASKSVYRSNFISYDSNQQAFTVDLFKVFTDQQHFKFNGFEKNDQHKHKLSILFGDSLYYGASQDHPSGMRSDAMVIDTSEHIVDLYKSEPVGSGLRSDAMVDAPDKREERGQRESVSSGTRSDFFANAPKRKEELDLNHSTKKKTTDDDGSASVQKKFQIQDQLLMDKLEKGKSLQRIENFENEKQYIDCLFNLTHEDYFKPVRDAKLLLRNGKFNEIEYCKFFDKALVYKAEKIYLEEDELTRTKKIDTRADFDIRTNGFYIKMECKNNWRLPRKWQNGLEVYLSNDRFVTNFFLARISGRLCFTKIRPQRL
jgi:hypothetical protein